MVGGPYDDPFPGNQFRGAIWFFSHVLGFWDVPAAQKVINSDATILGNLGFSLVDFVR